MKQLKKSVVVIGLAVAVSGATVALAQDDVAPEAPEMSEAVTLCIEANQTARQAAVAEVLGITVGELTEMRDSGMTLREIAAELGVDVPNIRDLAVELEDCQQIIHEERMAAIAEQVGISVEELQGMLDEGMTLREIADELGVELDLSALPGGPRGFDGPRNNGPNGNFGAPGMGGPGSNFDGPRSNGPGGNFDGPGNGGPRGGNGRGNGPRTPDSSDDAADSEETSL